MEVWCKENGVDHYVTAPAMNISLHATTPNSRDFSYTTERAEYAALPGAAWVPGWDFVIANDGTVLEDSGYLSLETTHKNGLHFPGKSHVAYYRPETRSHIPEAIFLSAPNHNIGHWLIDFLPRLIARDFAPSVPLIVPQGMDSRQLETLQMFDLGDRDVIQCPLDTLVSFDTLHVYRPGCSMPPSPEHVRFVRDALSRHARHPKAGRRFHLTRRSVGTRLVTNAAEFQAFLDRENFVSIDPADLSMREQQEMFADAETMIGAFGTNMLALYLAPPTCNIIVFMENVDLDPCIAPTAAILGMRHQDLICRKASVSGARRLKKDRDVVVDCDELYRRMSF